MNHFFFLSVIGVFLVEFGNDFSQLSLFLLNVETVAFQIVMFLLFENQFELLVETLNNVVELFTRFVNLSSLSENLVIRYRLVFVI